MWLLRTAIKAALSAGASSTPKTRLLSTSRFLRHGDDGSGKDEIRVTFVTRDGERVETLGRRGELALRLAQRRGVEMEGACEASLACTTCHCYVEDEDMFEALPEATETEEDLLDMAPFLKPNSRLGCQVVLSDEIDGIVLELPRATKNFYVDGHVPQPH